MNIPLKVLALLAIVVAFVTDIDPETAPELVAFVERASNA